ncbi:MAG: helix-turn-helix domain-containing protein [Bacillota bacterium]|uniref:Helix-turn-helix transcriptional regulator n=1 Tax=Virgibacillus salarius TaxID=447199 RepID=A0A941E0K1_9BACI|nr:MULTISPECIES: helix-turn-helix transcriptional regulator [Bacillaceae]NAZ10272.1 helix-turn-helix domain-containing protein [Agaribacter marinus]MBR7797563.1 helix-turn-helix transcriptional regulator [Virgibacillus salarius]MCC2251839.1 helix-turn-helix domain-containing protein [Virgibacillus sp. AGTR]MDY7046134.1 helix-turn-helix transcriptional regulator [Virgibacillus sp. M23]QRZ19120.1 helix-turn-helix transcriptional regulator [Virgibacillus sp. AGTR]
MDKKRIGRRIKAFRKLKGYTQIDFAKALGVPLSAIGGVERGSKELSEELLDKVAETLSVSKEELTLQEVPQEDNKFLDGLPNEKNEEIR